jgi:hypothetical protein
MPIKAARDNPLDLLRDAVEQTAATWIHSANRGHLGFGGIAGMQDGQQVRERHGHGARRAIGIAGAHTFLNFPDG